MGRQRERPYGSELLPEDQSQTTNACNNNSNNQHQNNGDDDTTAVQIEEDDDEVNFERQIWDSTLSIRWKNLQVEGTGTGEELARTLPVALGLGFYESLRSTYRSLKSSSPSLHKKLLHGVSGYVEEGEMLLVLGRPGSGVTTLLRSLAADWDGYSRVHGHLDYSGISPSTICDEFQGKVCYLPAEDTHFPSLSVKDTISVALDAKTPSEKVQSPHESSHRWHDRHLYKVLSSLGLQHCASTPVGNEFVRGVSGGERKRVSVAELLATRASIMCLDNVTDGLDSSTALELISLLQQLCKLKRRSIIVGLNQVSEAVYQKFDKVSLLHRGRQVYFGPAHQAKSYFENLGFKSLPGQTTADFLCACTDPSSFRSRYTHSNHLPCTSTELSNTFVNSASHKELTNQLAKYESRHDAQKTLHHVRLLDTLEKNKLATSIYTTNFFRQVQFLASRQFRMIRADLKPYVMKTSVNIALSVLVGTVFYHLPKSTEGAFTRGSILLLALLFNGYLQLAELGNALIGRPIARRHQKYGFYNPSALAVARVLSDLPLIALQVVLFAGITYFLAGLQREWERFLVYLLFVFAVAFNLTAAFRMFAAFSPSFDEAMRYCGIALNILVIYAGYFIPTPSMRPSLKWIHYLIDPISYAYEGVLVNEFYNLNLTCSEQHIVPHGPEYTDPTYQTCTLKGSQPGSLIVRGQDYLQESFGFSFDHIWFNLVIIFLLAIIFFLIAVMATQLFHFAPSGTVKVYARTKQAVAKLRLSKRQLYEPQQEDGFNDDLTTEAPSYAPSLVNDSDDQDTSLLQPGGDGNREDAALLTWKKLFMSLPSPINSQRPGRKLLNNISGYVKPGEMTALMGASGAGKTTLLDVLAGRCSSGIISGDILINGFSPGLGVVRRTGYVEQFGLHDIHSTVREALEFSALLRQDPEIPKDEKLSYVEFVLDVLDLREIQDAIVGTTCRGLSLEQRKLLTIGVELVSRPSVLFLDEPTSGLDSQSAYHIVRLMKRLARQGLAVLATIHQPSPEVFGIFDNLLLLKCGGEQVYFGPRTLAIEYFESWSGKSANDENPAEYILRLSNKRDVPSFNCNENPQDTILLRKKNPAMIWKDSQELKDLQHSIDDINSRTRESCTTQIPERKSPSTWMQTVQLTKRVSRNFWRDSSFSYTKIFTVLVVSLIIGLSFSGQDRSIVSLQNRMFSVFLILFVPPVLMNQNIVKSFAMRSVWEGRERPAKIYGPTAFCASLAISDSPYMLICGTIYFIWFFLVGFPMRVFTILYCYAMVILFFFFQSFFAWWITALAPSVGMVANLLPFFLVSMEVFNGSLISYKAMTPAWHWLYWVSPFQWYVKGVLGVTLHDVPITCDKSELVQFDTPPSMTCDEYASPFLSQNPGYLLNPSSSTTCEYCAFSVGDDFLSTLNISWNDRWISFGILLFYTILNLCLFFFFTQYPIRIPNILKRKSPKNLLLGESTLSPTILEEESET